MVIEIYPCGNDFSCDFCELGHTWFNILYYYCLQKLFKETLKNYKHLY